MIVALSNPKGGVGKSTLAVHMAVWLAEEGFSAVLVDADVQASSSTWLHEAAPSIPIARLQTPDEILEAVPELARQHTHVVVDGPAGLSEVSRAILLVTDLALLPCGPSALDLRAASEVLRVLGQARQIRKGAPAAMLVPNKLQQRHRLTRELVATLQAFKVPLTSGIHLRQAYADAAGQGSVVWRLGPSASPAANEIRELIRGTILFNEANIDRSAMVA